jgi:hypothetical protein
LKLFNLDHISGMLRPCTTASERAIYGEQVVVIDSKYTPGGGHLNFFRMQVSHARGRHRHDVVRSALSGKTYRGLFTPRGSETAQPRPSDDPFSKLKRLFSSSRANTAATPRTSLLAECKQSVKPGNWNASGMTESDSELSLHSFRSRPLGSVCTDLSTSDHANTNDLLGSSKKLGSFQIARPRPVSCDKPAGLVERSNEPAQTSEPAVQVRDARIGLPTLSLLVVQTHAPACTHAHTHAHAHTFV